MGRPLLHRPLLSPTPQNLRHRQTDRRSEFIYRIRGRLLELGVWAKRFGLIEDSVQCWAGLKFF